MKKKIYLVSIIVLFVILVFSPNVANYFKVVTKRVLGWPIKKISYFSSGVGNYFSLVGSVGSLGQENTELKARNMELESALIRNNEIINDNNKLKEALNYVEQTKSTNLITTKVIGHSPVNSLKTLEIDCGSENGVKVGQTVIFNGYLVGKISAIESHSSTVFLITNVNSLIPVMLQNSRAKGLLRGGISGLVIEKIPLDAEVIEDEKVVTSNIGNEVVENIAVGVVEEVVSQESEIFKKVSIKSPVEFDKLDILFVVK